MFDQNYGSKTTRWLYWFIAAMAIYALSTLWSHVRIAAWIGACVAAFGISLARREIRRNRRP